MLVKYRGSVLGIGWSFLYPLLLLFAFTLVFGGVFGGRWGEAESARSGIDMALFIYCGLAVFTPFSEVITSTPRLLLVNQNFIKKMISPVEILPVVAVLAALIHGTVQLLLLAGAAFVAGHRYPTMLVAPLVMVPVWLFTLGAAWFLAAAGAYLRDLAHGMPVLAQFLMFVLPVFYPAAAAPGVLRGLNAVNPLALTIERIFAARCFTDSRLPGARGSRRCYQAASWRSPATSSLCTAAKSSPMSSEPVISVRRLTKIYRVYDHPLQGLLSRLTGNRFGHHKAFHALEGLSFDVYRGETVGIIGRNGSGKSTLLQLICGIRKATAGSVSTRGRVSALLELGSGFHPEFTGRENVFLQGAIMGISRAEMEHRYEAIAEFADIGAFIDQTVKLYSSGMFVRLTFATAINVNPDVLIVDEALAVGDAGFQARCHAKFGAFKSSGKTTLLVTHDLNQVAAHCDRAIMLDRSRLVATGSPKEVVNFYRRRLGQAAGTYLRPIWRERTGRHSLCCMSTKRVTEIVFMKLSKQECSQKGISQRKSCNTGNPVGPDSSDPSSRRT